MKRTLAILVVLIVSSTGLAFFPALITSPKSIFTMMGNIMRKRQRAIGMDTTGASPE